MEDSVLLIASVASMIQQFNMRNIKILSDIGYKVEVACNFELGNTCSEEQIVQLKDDLKNQGVTCHQIDFARNVFQLSQNAKAYKQLKQIMAQTKYRFVHCHSPIGGVLGRLAAHKYHIPAIYTAHGFHFFKGAPKKNWLLFYPVERFLSRYTDVLVTINGEDYKIAQKFHAGKVHYVPGIGIDLEKYKEDSVDTDLLRESLGLAKEDFVIISVGELTKRKNQETLIRAMAEITDISVKYVMVGLGEFEEQFRELIQQLQLENRVILTGYRKDIPQLLRMADVFVFPSLQEGLPVALMEAMAVGLPVICGDIRGNTDLVTDKEEGRLVSPTDSHAFAGAIRELKKSPEKAELYGTNARKKMRVFTKEVVDEKMRGIYREM